MSDEKARSTSYTAYVLSYHTRHSRNGRALQWLKERTRKKEKRLSHRCTSTFGRARQWLCCTQRRGPQRSDRVTVSDRPDSCRATKETRDAMDSVRPRKGYAGAGCEGITVSVAVQPRRIYSRPAKAENISSRVSRTHALRLSLLAISSLPTSEEERTRYHGPALAE